MENVHFYFPLFDHFYIDIYSVKSDSILVARILNEKRDYMRILFGITEVDE